MNLMYFIYYLCMLKHIYRQILKVYIKVKTLKYYFLFLTNRAIYWVSICLQRLYLLYL